MTEPQTAAGRVLLDELQENPLAGARYAYTVVKRVLPAIEVEAAADPTELRAWAYDAAINLVEEVHPDCPSLGALRKMRAALAAKDSGSSDPEPTPPASPDFDEPDFSDYSDDAEGREA